jgi:hypothetical protein
MVPGHPSRSALSTPLITSRRISAQPTTRHRLRRERGGKDTTSSRTTTRAANELSPPKSACCGDAVQHPGHSPRGTVTWAIEDSISQCPFLQMTSTPENPHADGRADPGARPRYRPPRHRDLHDTSHTHQTELQNGITCNNSNEHFLEQVNLAEQLTSSDFGISTGLINQNYWENSKWYYVNVELGHDADKLNGRNINASFTNNSNVPIEVMVFIGY